MGAQFVDKTFYLLKIWTKRRRSLLSPWRDFPQKRQNWVWQMRCNLLQKEQRTDRWTMYIIVRWKLFRRLRIAQPIWQDGKRAFSRRCRLFFMRNQLSPLSRIPNLPVHYREAKRSFGSLNPFIESCAVLLTWPHAWVVSAVQLPNTACGRQSSSTSNYVVLEPNQSNATDCLTLE
jgi:hypothetical protein